VKHYGSSQRCEFPHDITNRNGGTYDLPDGKKPHTRIDFTDLSPAFFDFIETMGHSIAVGRPYSRAYAWKIEDRCQ